MKEKLKKILRWSQKYTKTDMLYATKGSFWIILGKGGMALISLGIMTAFANWLPQEEFGTYQFVLSVASILAIITLPGINTALIRSVAKGKEGSLVTAFRTRIKWGWLGTAGMIIASAWYFMSQNHVLGGAFLVGAIFFNLRNTASLFSNFWHGRKRFDIDAKYRIASSALSAIVLVTTLYLTDNVVYVVGVFFGSHAIFDYIFYLLTKKRIENEKVDNEVVPYGKSLTIMSIATTITNHLDKIILWKFLGPVQVAIYSFAILPIQRLKSMVPISTLALPKLSEKEINGERKEGVLDKFWKLMILMVPITILGIIVAPFAYKLVFPQYMESVIYAQILSLMFLTVPFTLLSTALVAEAREKELYIIRFTAPTVQTLLLFGLVPFFGIAGAVGAVLVGRSIQSGMEYYYFRKI